MQNITYDIHQYRKTLGEELCNSLLFIHAYSGCDTTSQFCGIGKGTAFDSFIKNAKIRIVVEQFSKTGNTKDHIEEAGEIAARILYHAQEAENINELQKRLLSKKVAKASSFVKPERLPPTKSALKFHSYRVYLQIMKWLANNSLKPEEWGWVNIKNKFYPKTTDKEPAPDSLLKTIGCNCAGDCST